MAAALIALIVEAALSQGSLLLNSDCRRQGDFQHFRSHRKCPLNYRRRRYLMGCRGPADCARKKPRGMGRAQPPGGRFRCCLEGVAWVTYRYARTGVTSGNGTAALLLDVRQLMGKNMPALAGARRVRPGAEDNVVAHGISRRAHRRGRGRRPLAGVDADSGQISAQPGFHVGSHIRSQRLPATLAHHVEHGGSPFGALSLILRQQAGGNLGGPALHAHGRRRADAGTAHRDTRRRQTRGGTLRHVRYGARHRGYRDRNGVLRRSSRASARIAGRVAVHDPTNPSAGNLLR